MDPDNVFTGDTPSDAHTAALRQAWDDLVEAFRLVESKINHVGAMLPADDDTLFSLSIVAGSTETDRQHVEKWREEALR